MPSLQRVLRHPYFHAQKLSHHANRVMDNTRTNDASQSCEMNSQLTKFWFGVDFALLDGSRDTSMIVASSSSRRTGATKHSQRCPHAAPSKRGVPRTGRLVGIRVVLQTVSFWFFQKRDARSKNAMGKGKTRGRMRTGTPSRAA